MRTSIAGKVRLFTISFTVILVLLGVILGGAQAALTARSDQAGASASRAMAAAQLATSIAESRYFASRFAASGDAEVIRSAFTTLEQAHAEVEATIALKGGDAASREQMEWLVTQVEGFRPELRALQSSIDAHGPSATGDALANAIDISGDQLAQQSADIEAALIAQSDTAQQSLETLKTWTMVIALTLIAGCIALVHLGAKTLSEQVSDSLGEITGAMTSLAGGDRSIAIPGTGREDEIGEMARALVVFRESADALADLQRKAREEQNAVLRRLVDNFRGGVGEVAVSVAQASRELQSTSTDMAGAATQTIGFVEQVSRDMAETQIGVTAAAAASDQFALSIAEIGKQAGNSASVVQDARQSTELADTKMAELAYVAEEIGGVVDLIGAIADRTNLLALNASIEAARGGEAGRGFAVVASEVKDLARQTRDATGEVAARIIGMQATSRESVDALAQIGERIREVELTATAIAQAVDEQSVSSRELARNLDLAANGVDNIGSSISQIAQMARNTGKACEQVLASADTLDLTAHDLDARSREFVESVRAA
jgi:methyl-accepting chemotaxis protein